MSHLCYKVSKFSDMVEVQKASMTCLKKASLWGNTFYELRSPLQIKKEINANTVKKELVSRTTISMSIE
jgi:hypothetical protein